MADQIAGMPKKYLIVGGAAVAGVLGYAYWKNGSSAPETVGVGEPIEAAADDYESPLGNSGGNSSGNFPGNVDPDKIDTNAEWTQAAVESLETSGWERSAVLSALGKYLAFKGLSASEVTIVMAARAVQGEPPTGGPFPIKDALPSPTVPAPALMKAPTGVKAAAVGKTSVVIDWTYLSGVKGYKIFVNGKQNGNAVLYSTGSARYLKPNTRYTLGVAGIYPGDKTGPIASITVTTKK